MKLQPLQVCRLCGSFRTWRRLLYLAGGLLVALILPGVLKTAALAVWSLACTVLLLYRILMRASRLPVCLRTPRPEDALCETVLVDAALIGRGTRLRAAAQPIDVAPELSLRLGSGTLLLGAAMVLTADELSLPDQSALHRAVHRINIVPQRLTGHQPVLDRTTQDGVTIVTVRDGGKQRRYYRGEAAAVSALCPMIWEGESRPMTDRDRERILDTARYIAQGNCRVTAYATALTDEEPVFLGVIGVGEEVDPRAVQDVNALRDAGLTVMLHAENDPEVDLTSLLALTGLPDYHARPDVYLTCGGEPHPTALSIHRARGESLVEPVLALQEAYRSTERLLRRFGLLLALTLLPCPAGHWTLPPVLCAMMLTGTLLFGAEPSRPAPGKWSLAACAAVTAVSWLFLGTTGGMAVGCGIIAVLTMLGSAMRMCGVTTPAALREWRYIPLAFCGGCLAVLTVIAFLLPGAKGLSVILFSVLMGAANAILLMRGK